MKRILLVLVLVACALRLPAAHAAEGVQALPRPAHVVIVIEENRAYRSVIGSATTPYINALAQRGALFSESYAVTHPSQPNYLALFSGSTQGVTDDSCPHTFSGDNLASRFIAAGMSFAIYSESLPEAGYAGCEAGDYQRKHNPLANWQGSNVPATANLPFARFPRDFGALPQVAMVVPNQANDMHDGWGPIAAYRGDTWLKEKLDAYVRWAEDHDSLLILTWDEDDGSERNRIPTLFVGPMVRAGVYAERIDHYRVLRTLLDMYGLAPLGKSAEAQPIIDVWSRRRP